jgi:DNA polymerase-4
MDAFYVNVHLLDHPQDAGIPLVVGGRPEGRGVVASASYEARRFGVHSAMPAARALRLCPNLKFAPHNWPRIKECSRQVMSLLRAVGPVQQMSVDEAYVDLGAHLQPETVAIALRRRVKEETALPASVGLASSKLVAKVASDYDKPEGCTIVRPGREEAFLAPLSVRVIWGIGPRTAERLARLDIKTCGQLARTDLALLRTAFGRQAQSLRERAQGIDRRSVSPEREPPKSISQERTFSRDVNDPDLLHERLNEMAAAVAEALQKRGLVAHTVSVKFRWADFTTFTRQKTVSPPIDGEAEIARQAQLIWRENWPKGQHMRLLGVGVSNLEEPQARQLTLF